MKKILVILLSILMILPFFILSAVAQGETTEADLPLIYFAGQNNATVYNADGTPIKNAKDLDRGAYIAEHAGPVLKNLGIAMITGDYSDYIASLVDVCIPIYEEQILTPDGLAQPGQYIEWDYRTVAIEESTKYGIPAYTFFYDSRLSPLDVADQLDIYIERVLAATGAEKVNISSRCMGTNFMMAYVAKSYRGDYAHPFRVQNLVHNTSSLDGYISIGALLSGSISLDADAIDRFATYYLENGDIIEDPAISLLAMSAVSMLNYAKILDLGLDVVERIYANVANELIPQLARISNYGRNPCYWSMVGSDYFEKAVEFVFNTDELKAEYAGLIDKITQYYDLLSAVNPETGNKFYADLLLELDSQSINSLVFAKYGNVTFPLFEGCELHGDARGTVTELSFGATTVNVGENFSKEYLENAEKMGTGIYTSPDKCVDASTCLFPDSTWFSTNIIHDCFPSQQNQLMLDFFASNGSLTVWDTQDTLPQYTEYSSGTLCAFEGDLYDSSWSNNPIVLLYRMVQAILDFCFFPIVCLCLLFVLHKFRKSLLAFVQKVIFRS